eukprot:3541648-Prymnesium_polylepis.1
MRRARLEREHEEDVDKDVREEQRGHRRALRAVLVAQTRRQHPAHRHRLHAARRRAHERVEQPGALVAQGDPNTGHWIRQGADPTARAVFESSQHTALMPAAHAQTPSQRPPSRSAERANEPVLKLDHDPKKGAPRSGVARHGVARHGQVRRGAVG